MARNKNDGTIAIQARVTPEEHALITSAAKSDRRSVASFVAKAAMDAALMALSGAEPDRPKRPDADE